MALQWATRSQGAQPCRHAQLLGKVRQFARHAHAADPRHEVPPPGLLPARPRRAVPYTYSDLEVDELIRRARALSGTTGLRPRIYATLLALLAVTGMRATEPLRLDRSDVDLDQGVLTVQESKFGKSRLVPVHPSTNLALADYAALRDRLCPHPLSPSFFLAECATRISYGTLRETFARLRKQAGLPGQSDSMGRARIGGQLRRGHGKTEEVAKRNASGEVVELSIPQAPYRVPAAQPRP